MSYSIPHNRLTLGKDEIVAAERVLASGWLAQGKEIESFENELCEFLGLQNGSAIAVSSGSSALYLAINVLRLNGKISIPTYTCGAVRNAVHLAGLEEKIVDNEPGKSSMDVSAENLKGSVASVVVHNYGIPASLPKSDQPFIEDCAQSIGATVSGKYLGTLGRIGVFSFFATKLITSGGQGGMVVSKDRDLIDQIRDYRNFDNRQDDKYRFNFQMTDLQAAIGRVQLRRLPDFLAVRNEIFEEYQNVSKSFLKSSDPELKSANYRAVLITQHQDQVMEHLKKKSIGCIVPIEDRELLGVKESFPHALAVTKSTVSIPIYPSLTTEERNRVVIALKELKQEGLIS